MYDKEQMTGSSKKQSRSSKDSNPSPSTIQYLLEQCSKTLTSACLQTHQFNLFSLSAVKQFLLKTKPV